MDRYFERAVLLWRTFGALEFWGLEGSGVSRGYGVVIAQ